MLVDLTMDLAEAIAKDMRECDRAEVLAASEATSVDWVAWAHRVMALPGFRIAATLDDKPLMMGGFIAFPDPEICGVWMVGTALLETAEGRAVAARAVGKGHREAAKRHKYAFAYADTANEDAMSMLMRLGYAYHGRDRILGGHRFVELRKDLT